MEEGAFHLQNPSSLTPFKENAQCMSHILVAVNLVGYALKALDSEQLSMCAQWKWDELPG